MSFGRAVTSLSVPTILLVMTFLIFVASVGVLTTHSPTSLPEGWTSGNYSTFQFEVVSIVSIFAVGTAISFQLALILWRRSITTTLQHEFVTPSLACGIGGCKEPIVSQAQWREHTKVIHPAYV